MGGNGERLTMLLKEEWENELISGFGEGGTVVGAQNCNGSMKVSSLYSSHRCFDSTLLGNKWLMGPACI